MPRVSDKHPLIQWFLDQNLQPELEERQHILLEDFLLRQAKSVISTVRKTLNRAVLHDEQELGEVSRWDFVSESISLSDTQSVISTFKVPSNGVNAGNHGV